MKTYYDVAIIGAGPAGAVAAALCARSGMKTILLEKKRLPRIKPCGGGVTAKAMDLLKGIGCFKNEFMERLVFGLMIHLPKTGGSYELVSQSPYLGTVQRSNFDMGLVEIARRSGAEVREAEGFVQYRRKTPYQLEIKIDTSNICASILIGADGFHSRVRRQVLEETGAGHPIRPGIFGISCEIPITSTGLLSKDHCHLFFNLMENTGYGWAFPRKDFFNIGLVIHAGKRKKNIASATPVDMLKRFMQRITTKETPWQRLGGGFIPLFDPRSEPVVQSKNVLLVGDAAGFADAWTGEGIYYSIQSAVFAHRVIHAAVLDQKGFHFPSDYARLCRQSFYTELKMSAWAARFFRTLPSAYSLLRHSRVRALFLPHTLGEIGYIQAFLKAFVYSLGYKASVLKDRG